MSSQSVSVQLYSIRREIERGAHAALQRIADIGFQKVEPYGFVERAEEYRGLFDEFSISAPTAHARLFGADLSAVFTAAKTIGATTVIDPHLGPARWATRESVQEIARELGEISKRAADHGLRVGYHNHEFEFTQRIDGVAAFEVLAGELDDAVVLELDTYWAAVGGESDVAALLGRLGERVVALHVKDGPLTMDDTEQVAVGDGAMDVPSILAAAPNALRVIELDDHTGDMFTAVERSFGYLTGLEKTR
ncbi:sugar phosphate isomerase/epimerase family protein [Humidisolicoccus flavus]|uniref:sugar phosphate isomerase/epimerase family protein n=1 Tax=Humidisolicoccus flavus TaxID=3111414 RepID=UPI003254913E